MALSFGFFDSNNGDRVYNATQFSSMFDGIINDGVYQTIGDKFRVTPGTGMAVNIGTGRAWFKRKWIYNSSAYSISLDAASSNPRIDTVVLAVDLRTSQRRAFFSVVKGTPASNPSRPAMPTTTDVYYMPLAYIKIPAGATSITQSNITNAVGSSATPYVTGILQVTSIENLTAQWEDQWNGWHNDWDAEVDNYRSMINDDMNDLSRRYQSALSDINADVARVYAERQTAIQDISTFLAGLKDDLESDGNTVISDFQSWMNGKESMFDTWFSRLQNELSSNQAANLAARIEAVDQHVEDEIKFVSVNVVLPSSENIAPGGLSVWQGVSIWQYIPDYYTAKAVIWEHASSYAYFAPTALDLKNGGAEIDLRIRNVSNETKTLSAVHLMFICTHN